MTIHMQSRTGHQKANLQQTVDITLQLLQGLGFKPSKVLKQYLKGRKKSSITRKEMSGLNSYLKEMYEEAYSYWVMMRIEQEQSLVPETNDGIIPIKRKFFRLDHTSYRFIVFENKVTLKIRKDDMIRKKSFYGEMDYENNKGIVFYMKSLKELKSKVNESHKKWIKQNGNSKTNNTKTSDGNLQEGVQGSPI